MLKRKSKRVLSIVLAVAMIVGLFPIAAFADETKEVSTAEELKSAISNASAGDTIVLASGTYDGSIVIDKDLTLAGPESGEAIITISETTASQIQKQDAINSESSGYSGIVAVKNATVTLKNITIKGNPEVVSTVSDLTHTNRYAGVVALDANVTLDNCDIKDITYTDNLKGMQGGFGIYAVAASAKNLVLNDVNITNFNKAGAIVRSNVNLDMTGGSVVGYGNQGVISQNGVQYAGNATINGTAFSKLQYTADNEWSGGSVAIYNLGIGTNSVIENVTTTETDYAISADSPTQIKSGSYSGEVYGGEDDSIVLSVTGGTFKKADGTAQDISDYVAEGNTVDSNGQVIIDTATAVASVNNVGYATLQAAIDAAKDGDTVTVIGDATEEHIAIRDKALTINGAGAAKVSDITVVNSADKKNVTINNLTFVGASKEVSLDTNPSALYLQNVGTATVKGCMFDLADSATGTTVAITSGTTDDVIVEDCTIDGYTIAGYHNPGCVNVTYTDNTIKNAPSGIAFVATDNVVVKNNTFENSNGIRLEPGWTTPADTCDKATFTGNKIISLSSDASSQYAIRATNSNGDNGFSGENLVIDHNYWGSANPDFDSIIKVADGATFTVDPEPYYTAPTMEAEDLNTYEPPYTGKYSYEIFTKVGENGTISVDRYATEGDDVTITVSPDEAYLLDELTVTTGGKEVEVKDNGDGTYTFKMPSADAKIVVTFAEDPDWEPEPEEPAMPFTDVNDNDWFYDVVLYAYDNGLMTGVSATEFAPNQTTTRGMIVSMLARLEGVTSAEDAGFADVAANDWYATAVNWAASVGVVNGYEDNTFRPNAPITREQMAAILYNYADYKGYDVSARADLSDYADAASISSWAEDVLAWANAEGLINGMTATTIDPQGATTRAQTAAMFERFLTAHEA